MVSRRRPRPSADPLWRIETRSFAPDLQSGDRLRFSLRANPTVKRNGTRHDVVMDHRRRLADEGVPKSQWPSKARMVQSQGTKWLASRAERSGFALIPNTVVVSSYLEHRLRKGRRRIEIASCDFDGLLEVEDAERFRATLFHGLGPAKAFGFGLLLCSRA